MSGLYSAQMRKPPITVKCDCGATQDVLYGERWKCPTCHRTWNTLQIPAAEYDGLLRRVRRHQFEVLAMAAVAAAVVIPLIVAFGSRYVLLTPILLAAWLFVVLPAWRRRYRRTARDAPQWELHPE
jgi:Flp pilus assembly protein TadB